MVPWPIARTMEFQLNKTKHALRDTLKELVSLPGVSGFEQEVVAYVRDRFQASADEVTVDRYGNVIASRRGRTKAPKLMLSAHMDEIGFLVKSIDADGFLRLDRIGGAGDGLLSCREVRVGRHAGLIGSKSGHHGSPEELMRVTPLSELYVDVGASSASEVSDMGIRIGDPVSFVGHLRSFANADRVSGKAMDDRVGLAILIQVLDELKDTELFGSFCAVATVLEQIGFRGATMVTARVRPDYAVTIDGVPSADTPDLSLTRDIPVKLGHGPVVLVAGSTRNNKNLGSIAHPAMKHHLLSAARAEAIQVQLASLLDRGSPESATVHLANGGIPTINVGVPRRYSYSPHEVVDLNDAAKAVKLLARFAREMEKHQELNFI
jgi:putative aminopeptidase